MTTLSCFPLSSPSSIKEIAASLPNSSPGLDGLRAILFRRLSSSLSVPMSALNTCILHSSLPTPFTMNTIQPRFKQIGTKTTMTSYRPLAYTLVVATILENNIHLKLLSQVDNLLYPSTHGFLPQRGTRTNLLAFYDELANLLPTNDIVYGPLP